SDEARPGDVSRRSGTINRANTQPNLTMGRTPPALCVLRTPPFFCGLELDRVGVTGDAIRDPHIHQLGVSSEGAVGADAVVVHVEVDASRYAT
ncbi:MAG: hypothetical protein ACYDB3_00380, partial [Acidimicrobiales bacterium]